MIELRHMTYDEAIAYLSQAGDEVTKMKPGLERVRMVLIALQNPHYGYRVVHVAGTNGKGSTCAMTESIVRSAGYVTGLYTSPHISFVNERIQVSGASISNDDFCRGIMRIKETCEMLASDERLHDELSFFEKMTILAFWYFNELQVDVAILEVGIGGRLDATNVCVPTVCAIAALGYDHQDFLGDTITEIAVEKAGIAKENIPFIIGYQPHGECTEVLNTEITARGSVPVFLSLQDSVRAVTNSNGAYAFTYVSEKGTYPIVLNMHGEHQVQNACLAIMLVERLVDSGLTIPIDAYSAGLASVQWPGRLEYSMYKNTRVLLDGAHNLDGIRTLVAYIKKHELESHVTLLFSALAGKPFEEMLRELHAVSETIVITEIEHTRGLSLSVLENVAAHIYASVSVQANTSQALDTACIGSDPRTLVCVCGSLYLVREMREMLQEKS